MPEQEACPLCGAPLPLRHCLDGNSGLRRLMFGNHVDLMICGRCGALWCFASHRGEARSPVGVRWTYAPRDWQRAYDVDDGASLNRWHLRQVREACRTLPHPCGRRVCRFRRRCHTPVA
jgi:hypothetical protein